MKRLLFLLGLFFGFPAFLPQGATALAHGQSMSVGFGFGYAGSFYEDLRPYGEWIEVEAGFYAWRPVRVRHGWRPYLYGRWVWTDYGWYWHSFEPFGWAVFHYGRWYFDEYYGWIWIPDTIWGPAWVEWRYNDDYVGWAPLPPYASFSISIGIRFTTRWYAPPHYWCFVRYRHFPSTRIDSYVVDEGYSRRLIRTTRTAVRYEVDRDRIINRGIDRDYIERRGNIRITRTEVEETRNRRERIIREGSRERIEIYRPQERDEARRDLRIEARKPERRISLDLQRIERNRSAEERDGRSIDSRSETIERRRPSDQDRTRDDSPALRRETPEPQRRSPEYRPAPDRGRTREEFRSIQPARPSVKESPSRQPQRREGTSTRSQPRREGGSSDSRGRNR